MILAEHEAVDNSAALQEMGPGCVSASSGQIGRLTLVYTILR